MARYAIRRVGLSSALKFGLALGLLATCLPACLCALLAVQAVGLLRGLLEGLAQAKLSLLGQNIPLNLVELLRLNALLESLRSLDALGWLLALSLAMILSLGATLFAAFTVWLIGLGYNALAAVSGGIVVDVDAPYSTTKTKVPTGIIPYSSSTS